MKEPVAVCELDELADPGSRGFQLPEDGAGGQGFVVRRGAEVFAYVDSCPHTGAPLAWLPDRYLDIEGMYIQCSLHGALFRVADGYCIRGPCAGRALTPLAVHVTAGRVFVAPPATAR